MVHRIFACLKLFPVCSKCFRSPVAKHPSLLTTDRGVFRYRYSAHLQVAGRAEQSDHKTRIRGNGAARPPTGSSRSADPLLPPLASARRRYFTGPGRPSPPMRRRSSWVCAALVVAATCGVRQLTSGRSFHQLLATPTDRCPARSRVDRCKLDRAADPHR